MRKAQQFLKRDLNFCAKWLIRERRLPGAQSDLPAGLLQELQRMMKQRRVPLRRQILTPGVQNRYHLCVSKLLDYWEGKATTLHEPEEYDAGLA